MSERRGRRGEKGSLSAHWSGRQGASLRRAAARKATVGRSPRGLMEMEAGARARGAPWRAPLSEEVGPELSCQGEGHGAPAVLGKASPSSGVRVTTL